MKVTHPTFVTAYKSTLLEKPPADTDVDMVPQTDTYVDVGIVDATARIEIADNCIDTTDGKTLTRKSLVR